MQGNAGEVVQGDAGEVVQGNAGEVVLGVVSDDGEHYQQQLAGVGDASVQGLQAEFSLGSCKIY